jgi:hypothetical protein
MKVKTPYRGIAGVIITVTLIFCISACSSGVTGKYMVPSHPDQYIEFKSDNTFYIQDGPHFATSGTYSVNGKEITVNAATGLSEKLTLDGSKLRDPMGKIYEKQ